MSLTKFEKARIIGARALQISMGAPVIIDVPKNLIDPVDIAMLEYDNNVIPIVKNSIYTFLALILHFEPYFAMFMSLAI